MLRKTLQLKKKVTFNQLEYEDIIKIANHLSIQIHVEKEDSIPWKSVKERVMVLYPQTIKRNAFHMLKEVSS